MVAIFGPTASGKSAVAVALAQAIDGEIVSADSMQIYRGLERLTNQPTPDEQGGIPHHLVGHVEPTVSYDVSRFATDAHAAIDSIMARDRTPIVVGGSGLYLRAALAEAVLGAGVILTASTKIIDVSGSEPVEHVGYVPPRKVVIPGTRPRQFPAGTFDVPCALIIGERTESTDRKTSLNSALRELGVDV